jgi:hypothetical protein
MPGRNFAVCTLFGRTEITGPLESSAEHRFHAGFSFDPIPSGNCRWLFISDVIVAKN